MCELCELAFSDYVKAKNEAQKQVDAKWEEWQEQKRKCNERMKSL